MNFTVKSVQNGCRLGSLVNKTQGIVVETPTCMLYTKSGRCPALGAKISGLFSLPILRVYSADRIILRWERQLPKWVY